MNKYVSKALTRAVHGERAHVLAMADVVCIVSLNPHSTANLSPLSRVDSKRKLLPMVTGV